MATRRMLNKEIIDSDDFLEMPMTAQLLYFHFNLRADDDGFLDNWKSIMRLIGAKTDDIKILASKDFIIPFDSGVIVIKHWRMHNYIRKDRHIKTKFQAELSQLEINENQSYQLLQGNSSNERLSDGCQVVAERLPDGCQMVDTGKDRLGKDRLGKESIEGEYEREEETSSPTPTHSQEKEKKKSSSKAKKEEKVKYAENVEMTEAEYQKLLKDNGNDVELIKACISKLDNYKGATGKKYKSDYRAILSWVLDDQKQRLLKQGNKIRQISTKKTSYDFHEAEKQMQKGHILYRRRKV